MIWKMAQFTTETMNLSNPSHCSFFGSDCSLVHWQPDLTKVCINSMPNKNGIDTKKLTLACVCYAMGRIRVVG